ncbi:Mucin-2 [Streptomyces sp. SBR177]
MVAHHASALDGVARNPALPTPLLLRLLAFDGTGDGTAHGVVARALALAVQRPGLPEAAVARILAHPLHGVREEFATSARADPAQRARLADDPCPGVRAALAHGPDGHAPRTPVLPLPDEVCARLLADPDPSVRTALLNSPYLTPSFTASLATHRDPAARRIATRAWAVLPAGERAALLADHDPAVRRAAALRECRRDADLTAELLRDPESAVEALRHGLLHRADAERLVAERTRPADLAGNPSLPADLVERLAVDPDEDVRLAVSLRPELDETRRMRIAFTVGEFARGTWSGYGTGRPTPKCCAGPRPPPIRCCGAPPPRAPTCRPNSCAGSRTPGTRWWRTCWASTTRTRRRTSSCGCTSGSAARSPPGWRSRTPLPREGLAARYADHPDGAHRRLAVRDPAATPALIERLSHDPAVWTRQAAAGDPRLPLPRLREALHIPELASSAGANPALPVEEMAGVLERAGVPA